MSELTDAFEERLGNHFCNRTQDTMTPCYLALHTVLPTDSSAGTEVSGNGYARVLLSFAAWSAGKNVTGAAALFTAAGGAWGTIVGASIYTASTGGTMKSYTPVTNQAVADGGSLNFPIGSIEVAFA